MNLSPLYIIKNGSCGSWYGNTVGIISSYNKKFNNNNIFITHEIIL